jgi:hypothetical protein
MDDRHIVQLAFADRIFRLYDRRAARGEGAAPAAILTHTGLVEDKGGGLLPKDNFVAPRHNHLDTCLTLYRLVLFHF